MLITGYDKFFLRMSQVLLLREKHSYTLDLEFRIFKYYLLLL